MTVLFTLVCIMAFLYTCNVFESRHNRTKKSPYKEYMNIPLILNDNYILCDESQFKLPKEKYFILKDDNRAGLHRVAKLPKGTIIVLNKAIQYHTGLSGVIGSYVVGKVYIDSLKEEIIFYCGWGHIYNDFKNGKRLRYWQFEKAIWQTTEDTTRYYTKSGEYL